MSTTQTVELMDNLLIILTLVEVLLLVLVLAGYLLAITGT